MKCSNQNWFFQLTVSLHFGDAKVFCFPGWTTSSLGLTLLDYFATFAMVKNKVELQKKFETFNYSVETTAVK